jgi:hypothetical protein
MFGAEYSRREIMLLDREGVPLEMETIVVEQSGDNNSLMYSTNTNGSHIV